MPEINSPEIVAEIESLHDAYERALVANDVAVLEAFFWNSPDVVRYGVNEQLYGAEALAAYRRSSTPVFTDRRLIRRQVLTLGSGFASVMSELEQMVFGRKRHNRQSQVWVRFPDAGWKIVAAHVSNAVVGPPEEGTWEQYTDQLAAALRLTLDPAHRPGVVQNLQRSAAIAAPLMSLELPSAAEAAPVFAP
jgi:AtzH-like/1-carboxybiuret hydrolase subunit AtzG-like